MPDPTVTTRLLWIVLPNGIRSDANGRRLLHLSVRLAPRVTGAATLADCPLFSGSDGSGTWPAKARLCRFELLAAEGSGADPRWVDVHTQGDGSEGPVDPTLPDEAVWRALMPDTLAIEPHVLPTAADAQVGSYSVRAARDALVAPYRTSPDEGPPGQFTIAPPWTRLFPATPEAASTLRQVTRDLQNLRDSLSREQFTAAASATGFGTEVLQMDRMANFYDELSKGAKRRYDAAREVGFKHYPPAFDFHAAIAIASRYPALMRALGLLFDIELPVDELMLPAQGWLRVRLAAPSLPAAKADRPVLATRFAFGPGDRFVAIPREDFAAASDLVDRMLLPASPDDYCSVDVNLSELHHGVRNAVARFQAELARGTPLAAALARAPLPSPRSDGVALARDNHGARLTALIAAQAGLETALATAGDTQPLLLGAEQLLQGFRVDIQANGGPVWRSLCQRQGRYTFTAAGFSRDWPADEGVIGFHAFDPAPAGSADSAPWAHETWFRWQGWSLAAPRPGRHVGIDGASAGNDDAPAGNLGLNVSFTAPPGSLPRLRFGSAYACRLRAVDLAGNSLAADDAIPDSFALPLGAYLRFDPLAAPVLLAPAAPGPGESIERLVIHGDGVTASAETAERLLAPPKTTQAMAEWHGMFDTASSVGADAFARLQGRDGNWPEPPDPGLFGAVPPALPYLPDPLARQACVDFHPDQLLVQKPPLPMLLPFDGAWPELRPLRLRLVEGRGDPQWDATARLLTVPIPAGQTRSLNLSSLPADDAGFALFDWWQALLDDPARARRREGDLANARRGRNRGLTPWRRLTLVNAVQRPLVRPDFGDHPMDARRASGETVCRFVGVTAVDAPSTLKLELMATWDQAVDNGVDAPLRQPFSMLAYRRDVAPDEKDPTFNDRPWTWDLGDDHPGGAYLLPFHEFRDTRHRRVTYRTVATSRYAEYFGPGDPTDGSRFTQVSLPSTLEVSASARPAAPKVLRVVPTFRWDEQVDAQGVRTRTRRTGVRVVMDRPWYTSGDGEQLGVMLLAADPNPPPPPPPPDPDPGPGPLPFAGTTGSIPSALVPLVTQWGADPTIDGPDLPPTSSPAPTQFTNAAAVVYGITPAEPSPGAIFAVAVFDVQFAPPDPDDPKASADPARHSHDGHWVADIDIDPGAANFPFMRLALVRFQTHAVVDSKGDQRVSTVVLADIVQLAPGRSVRLVADAAQATAVWLTLDGAAFGTADTTRCAATVQADCGNIGAPLWLDFDETVLTPHAPTRLSLPFARDTRAMRVVVREFERRSADGFPRTNIADQRSVERLVFADVIGVGRADP